MSNSNLNTFDSVPSGVSAIFILTFCVFSLFEKTNSTDTLFIYSEQSFWIIVSFLFYFAGTFFIFLFAKGNLNDSQYDSTFKIMNNGFSILRNIILGFSFFHWRIRKERKVK